MVTSLLLFHDCLHERFFLNRFGNGLESALVPFILDFRMQTKLGAHVVDLKGIYFSPADGASLAFRDLVGNHVPI